MSHFRHLILGLLSLLFVKSSIQSENSTSVTADVGSTVCERGKKFYDSNKQRCRMCPRCKKANNYMLYNLKFSNEFGALECYPCYCKLGKKAYDPETKRCVICPCNINGVRNTSVDISVDEWFGAMKCYPCVCKPGFFKTALTHYQCVGCLDCQLQNKNEVRPCSPTSNAECGDCLEGYSNINGMGCVKNRPSTTAVEDLQSSGIPTGTPIPSSEDQVATAKRSYIFTVVILIMVVVIAFVVIYICYGFIKRRASNHSLLELSMTTSGTTMSSENSVKKNVDQNCASPISASQPLLRNDLEQDAGQKTAQVTLEDTTQDMLQDTLQHCIQEHTDERTVVMHVQVGNGNTMYLNTPDNVSF